MSVLLQISETVTNAPLLLGIPESVGLLAFGIGLVMLAVLLRKALGPSDAGKSDEKLGKKA